MGFTTGGNERGCQDGDCSCLSFVLVMFVRPLPSGFITRRSPPLFWALAKMIFVPSGDHAWDQAWVSVSFVGLEPSALTTQRCDVVSQQPKPLESTHLMKVIFEPSGDHAGRDKMEATAR